MMQRTQQMHIQGRGQVSTSEKDAYYRPELDALRFFAFLCVFSFHRMDYVPTDPVLHPWLFRIGNIGPFGVPVFFLLSAFLITELLLRERERTGKIHIKAFYVRRILRIWPLYFVAFFGLALLNHFVPGVGTGDPFAWLAFTFFAGNWYILHHGWIAGAVDPLWSISVEEQFYIVIPVLAAFAGRRAVAIVSCVLLGIAYVTVLLYALHPTVGDNGEWTNSFVAVPVLLGRNADCTAAARQADSFACMGEGTGIRFGLCLLVYGTFAIQSAELGAASNPVWRHRGLVPRPGGCGDSLPIHAWHAFTDGPSMARISGPNFVWAVRRAFAGLLPYV